MTGKPTQSQRSYSPVYKCRGLNDDDPDEVYDERVAEMALEMDMAMEYLGDLNTFFKKREDIAILENCEEMAAEAIDEHIDLVEKVYALICAENEVADLQMEEMFSLQQKYGLPVEPPVLSIEGEKVFEKERKKKKKISAIYDIDEDEKENAENSDGEDAGDLKSESLSS